MMTGDGLLILVPALQCLEEIAPLHLQGIVGRSLGPTPGERRMIHPAALFDQAIACDDSDTQTLITSSLLSDFET